MWRIMAALAAALVLSACGSSTHDTAASAPTTGSTPTRTTTPTSTTVTHTVTATTTTQATSTQSSTCRAAGLHLSFLGGQAATGHGLLGFTLRNVGTGTCHMFGYPGILFLDSSGRSLPTITMRTTHDFFGSAPLHSLTVAPGETVSFRVGVTHFGPNGSNTGCTTASGLQVIPPNDTSTLRVAIGNGGEYECQTASLSPVQPGTSAYP
jgi:Domain of unknown function (DUF4232)